MSFFGADPADPKENNDRHGGQDQQEKDRIHPDERMDGWMVVYVQNSCGTNN